MTGHGYPTVPCGFCPAQMIWAATGRAPIPVSATPDPRGNIVLTPRAAGVPLATVTTDPDAYPGALRWLPHFDDCPGADTARRAKPKPPSQSETLF